MLSAHEVTEGRTEYPTGHSHLLSKLGWPWLSLEQQLHANHLTRACLMPRPLVRFWMQNVSPISIHMDMGLSQVLFMDFHPGSNHCRLPPGFFSSLRTGLVASTLTPSTVKCQPSSQKDLFRHINQIVTPLLKTSSDCLSYSEEKPKTHCGLQVPNSNGLQYLSDLISCCSSLTYSSPATLASWLLSNVISTSLAQGLGRCLPGMVTTPSRPRLQQDVTFCSDVTFPDLPAEYCFIFLYKTRIFGCII